MPEEQVCSQLVRLHASKCVREQSGQHVTCIENERLFYTPSNLQRIRSWWGMGLGGIGCYVLWCSVLAWSIRHPSGIVYNVIIIIFESYYNVSTIRTDQGIMGEVRWITCELHYWNIDNLEECMLLSYIIKLLWFLKLLLFVNLILLQDIFQILSINRQYRSL